MTSAPSLLTRFRTPLWQSLLVGLVLFCCPGMFDAINGMGAGGQAASSTSLVAKSNSALYACFAIIGFFGGSVNNTIGPRWTLFIGTFGYAVYVGSLWCLDRGGPEAFVIAGGALCGLSAGLLWTAQGFVVMSYPREHEKSRHFAYQWSMLGVGAAIGGLIPFAQIMRNGGKSGDKVSTGSYVGFFIVICVGIVASFFLADPAVVKHKDGTPVTTTKPMNFRDEFKSVCGLVFDWKIMALAPACLASNWFYAYQFSMNAFYFSLRSRTLNSMIYWLTQVFGTFGISAILDATALGDRRRRGIIGLAVISIFVLATWSGGAAFQSTFSEHNPSPSSDWTDSNWAGPFVLYVLYGMADAMYQSYCYWLMGAITNDPWTLARYAGFYKGLQSAGGALSFGISAAGVGFMRQLIVCFVLQGVSLPLMFVVAKTVSKTNYASGEDAEEKTRMEVGEKDAAVISVA
ncbi:MFS general substrate transporter [Saitoella complicata NRRL Y-17804]|nr:MFS general substrate transporter [Saitoella complicata NRRL Y-17804]ODQ54689.1 MFS general substrate transporter [Saitoella complicata NRRL Y-17804]